MLQCFTNLLYLGLLYLSLITSSSSSSAISDLSSSSYSSIQTKFWSDNVINKMPLSISTKLSPLTKHDVSIYTAQLQTLSHNHNNNNFKANSKFCATAKLACSRGLRQEQMYSSSTRTYNNNKVSAAIPLKNVDPFSFFRLSILQEGNTIHLTNLGDSLPYRAFLPPQIASRISLLTTESVAASFPDSAKAAIANTLSYCNAEDVEGEIKSCPRSLEEMISFSRTALGTLATKKKLRVLASDSTRGSGEELTIRRIRKFDAAEKIVACHEMFLPFTIYFCHSLTSTRMYSVEFVDPRTKVYVNTVTAICHMDTSAWPETHVAFKILKFGPGHGEACHWLGEIDLAWIDGGN